MASVFLRLVVGISVLSWIAATNADGLLRTEQLLQQSSSCRGERAPGEAY
jgi:hypothetical protein